MSTPKEKSGCLDIVFYVVFCLFAGAVIGNLILLVSVPANILGAALRNELHTPWGRVEIDLFPRTEIRIVPEEPAVTQP